ncbi:MAG: hypothetical protein KF702_05425 [Gammaproteobacteria bacterium]|nr:hypothetical protein [Gammaproteobacteria bacterium]
MDRETRYRYWQTLVEEQEKSGLSQTEFCRQHQLVLSQFSYYRSVFKSQKEINKSMDVFQPIQFKINKTPLEGEIKIILPSGLQCIFPVDAHISQIKSLLEVLRLC